MGFLKKKFFAKTGDSVSSRNFVLLLLLTPCSQLCFAPCFAPCCHDPFIVRSASNLFTVPWFQSVCASVSMFTINTGNCLFPFPSMFLFLFLYLYLSSTRVSVHMSRPPCVHTKSADSTSVASCSLRLGVLIVSVFIIESGRKFESLNPSVLPCRSRRLWV